jgi:hypothetical protein
MRAIRTVLLALPLAMAGCMLSPVHLAVRPELAHRLPPGITMNDYVETNFGKVNVGEKLARLGAYPGQDGGIFDLSGCEIKFFKHYDGGMPPPAGTLERAQKELQQLKAKYTVIEIRRDPDLPPPV